MMRPLRFDPVPEGAEELIGYEPRTVEFDPRDPAQAREFLAVYQEALDSGGRVLPVRGARRRAREAGGVARGGGVLEGSAECRVPSAECRVISDQ
jgi:hypothetical protein